MGWRATDLSENDAHHQAADLNVIFNQYGQRNEEDHREVDPPIEVEAPTWSIGAQLDYWIKERREWWARYAVGTVAKCGSKPLIFGR
jgi:hypothetical protein